MEYIYLINSSKFLIILIDLNTYYKGFKVII